jgi:hypothetical protein
MAIRSAASSAWCCGSPTRPLTVDGAAVTPLHGEVAYQSAAGEHRDLVLHFIHHATCDRDFVLRFDGSLTLGNRRLALAELTFVP